MESRLDSLKLVGLSNLDQAELSECLADFPVSFEEQPLDENAYGELATLTALVVVSAIAIKGIIAWMLKSRHHGEIEQEIEYVSKEGVTKRTTIRVRFESSEAPEKDIIAAIGSLGVDPAILQQVASSR
jgi:hypothetical protein